MCGSPMVGASKFKRIEASAKALGAFERFLEASDAKLATHLERQRNNELRLSTGLHHQRSKDVAFHLLSSFHILTCTSCMA